jgi:dipeptidyl aminopeptidase/acylaminoacyl peptidase
LVGESFTCAPEIALIRQGRYQTVRSFAPKCDDPSKVVGEIERVTWLAPDGLEIQGWLLRPHGAPPHPLITYIHGGPVWHWRPTWLGRVGVPLLMLLKRGGAIFLPNPRGSGGRGQAFARRVVGDMGGSDTDDFLSGIDALVERGVADSRRLGVTGHSYGGFMTAWLIAQDARFAAAVTSAPVTHWVTEHLLSNIPHWPALFLGESYSVPEGKYFKRSPVMYASQVKTPTLSLCGRLDRSAPPEEAAQFHNALLQNGVRSVLVTYPFEGHGVRTMPALIDCAARIVGWFEELCLGDPGEE